LEPEVIVRSNPLLDHTFEAGLHKGYLKADFVNLELAFGRDTLFWGPASQGDLVISNNAPPLNLVKFTTPQPFRLPGPYHDLGEWQIAYFVARLEAHREFSHALLSGFRLTYQPAALVKFGYTNAFQAYGSGGVSLSPGEYLEKIFVPTLSTTGRTANGLVAYDVVLSVPFVRRLQFLKGLKLYWQRGQDNVRNIQGVLGGGNILGGVLEGGRWDVRFEFVETRDAGSVWYTHPTYSSGFAFQQFVIGHPIGGAAQGFFGRATYYLTPTAWIAADGRHEQYGFETRPALTTQQRFGLEGSYQFPWQQRYLTLRGRFEYATLEQPGVASEHAVNVQLSTHWRFYLRRIAKGCTRGRAQGERRDPLRTGIEGFNRRAIDLDSHGLLDDVHVNDQPVPLFFLYEYALSTSEQAALDPDPHAFDEVRMWTTGEAMLHHGAHCSDLLLGYRHWFAIDAHKACYTDSFQHGDFVLQSKIAKEIAAEQRDLNVFDPIFPDTALAPQR